MKLSKACTVEKYILTVLVALAITVVSAPGFSQEMAEGKGSPTYTINTGIEIKRPDYIVTKDARKFMIAQDTIVQGTDGDRISLRSLVFPCKAEIVYYGPQKGSFWVKEINVIEESDFGSSAWSEKPPR
ncbi:MAG: hypothetical protein K9K62_00625 [Desulfobacteraceae bacterium]|nr:hypothetical protein [Desulfobacteraceae bacterium]